MPPPYAAGVPVREVQAKLDNKSLRQIYRKASSLKVRRPRSPPKRTGMELVDLVRERAFQLRMTMADLDFHTGGGRYFNAPQRCDLIKLQRAIRLLGGVIEVVL